jgi:hypothetical protein
MIAPVPGGAIRSFLSSEAFSMSLFHFKHKPRDARRFLPRCEALEARDCPSSVPGAFVTGHTLVVQGDANANTVAITDDGQGNVTATIDGKSVTGAHINRVVVNTGAGNDTLNYTLTGSLAVSEAVFIQMGTGTDSATLDFTPGVSKGNLRLSAEGKGTDTITASLGSIAAGASVRADLEGANGNDNLAVNFSGLLNGSLGVKAEGGKGNDTITGTITINAGSTGRLNAKVEGGAGTDNLTLNVTDNSADPVTGKTGLARLRAKIEANPNDTVTHTPNVTVEGNGVDDHGQHAAGQDDKGQHGAGQDDNNNHDAQPDDNGHHGGR